MAQSSGRAYVGDLVLYKLDGGRYPGEQRPALVVQSWDGQKCNLVVFTDSVNDQLPPTLQPTSVEHGDLPGQWLFPKEGHQADAPPAEAPAEQPAPASSAAVQAAPAPSPVQDAATAGLDVVLGNPAGAAAAVEALAGSLLQHIDLAGLVERALGQAAQALPAPVQPVVHEAEVITDDVIKAAEAHAQAPAEPAPAAQPAPPTISVPAIDGSTVQVEPAPAEPVPGYGPGGVPQQS